MSFKPRPPIGHSLYVAQAADTERILPATSRSSSMRPTRASKPSMMMLLGALTLVLGEARGKILNSGRAVGVHTRAHVNVNVLVFESCLNNAGGGHGIRASTRCASAHAHM